MFNWVLLFISFGLSIYAVIMLKIADNMCAKAHKQNVEIIKILTYYNNEQNKTINAYRELLNKKGTN